MAKKTSSTNAPKSEHAPPVEVKRIGAYKGNIWANDGQHGTIYTVTVERVYYAGNEWKSTRSIDADGLLVMAKVLDWCHTWIVRRVAEDRAKDQ